MQDLSYYLDQLYPQDADRIRRELQQYKKHLKLNFHLSGNSIWYKYINLYVTYPDAIQIKKTSALKNIIAYLPIIKKAGFNAVHILPFLKSPMIDKGFDVSDFNQIRRNLGRLSTLKELVNEAHKLDIKIFMDLVLNHVSDQHSWFQEAQKGNRYFREYFFYRDSKPEFIEKVNKNSAVWAHYKEGDQIIEANIAFPEAAGPIPHWFQGKDKLWYYHTYYPQQPDVNWFNPQVFIEYAKILMNWAALGFNFRLDAVPFVGKAPYKDAQKNDPTTHWIVNALNWVAKDINPECAFIIESYEDMESIISYYGSANEEEAQLAYNFFLSTHLWVSLIEQNVDFIWEKLDQMWQIPNHAIWVNFLRNHDELSLAHLEDTLRIKIVNEILPNGAPFRSKFGVSGRTYSLLGGDLKKFIMSYFLLASLPGSMSVPFGDEYGKENILLKDLDEDLRNDTRNINRGLINKDLISTDKSEYIFNTLSGILHTRRLLFKYVNIWPKRIKTKDVAIFACSYNLGSSELAIFINMSNDHKTVKFKTLGFQKVAQIDTARTNKDEIILNPYSGVWLQR